jgi:Excalibur calcium-binding domain
MLRGLFMAGAIAVGIAPAPMAQAALDRDGDGIACEVCH